MQEWEKVAKAIAGDQEAFNQIYQRYTPYIVATLRNKGCRQDQIEDLTQDTWMKAVEKLETLEDVSKLKHWLASIAKNNFIQSITRAARFRNENYKVDNELLNYPEAKDPDPSEECELNELVSNLSDELNSLDDKYSIPLRLIAIEQLSYKECSDLLDISVSCLKSRVHRARNMIKATKC